MFTPFRAFLFFVCAVALIGCGDSSTPAGDTGPAGDAAPDATVDGGGDATPDAPDDAGDAGVTCTPVTCEIACMYGFARGPDGCEICECAVEPDDSCEMPTDCALATDVTDCCGCVMAYAGARVDREPCLVRDGETPPPGCLPDPELCAVVDCFPCEPATSADCQGGKCVGSP